MLTPARQRILQSRAVNDVNDFEIEAFACHFFEICSILPVKT
jgi:trehalose-6-phosphate synthase